MPALASGGEGERPEDVVQMVIRAMAHNYEQIKTAEANIEMVMEHDPSNMPPMARPRDANRKQQPNVVSAFSLTGSASQHVTLRGEDVRYEEKGDHGSWQTMVYREGKVFHYTPSSSHLQICRPEDLPHRPPIDPRQVGAPNSSVGLADWLRGSELLEAGLVNRADSQTVARVVVRWGPRDRAEYQFDSAVGFLPTRRLGIGGDGSVISCLEVTYQDVLDRKARFLKEAVETFFPPGATKTPAEKGWHQRVRETVTELRINQPVQDSAFQIDVPLGTVVADSISKQWSVYGQESAQAGGSRRFIWYAAGIGLVILLAVVIYVRSRRRSVSQ